MKLKLIILILCSFFVAFFINLYIKKIEKKYLKKKETIDVLVSKQFIEPRTIITNKSIEIVKVPKEYVQPGSFHSIEEIYSSDGKQPMYLTVVPILKGEQILSTKLTAVGINTGLSALVPLDTRAFVLMCDKKTTSKIIYPGDRVDIIATFDYTENNETQCQTKTILQNILVLAVGEDVISKKIIQETAKNHEIDKEYSDESEIPVVLSVTPEQAQILALFLNEGKLTLSLRGLNDNNKVELSEINIKKIKAEKPLKSQHVLTSIQKQYDEVLEILKKYQK